MSSLSTTAVLEPLQPLAGSSIIYRKFSDELPNGDPVWHYHPEIELVYIRRGNGKRHIGNHISYYTEGDLILIGPNVPHYGFTDRLTQRNTEIVLQFRKDFLGLGAGEISEFRRIFELLRRAEQGISFNGRIRHKVGEILDQMSVQSSLERLLSLISALHLLASSEEYQLLNTSSVALESRIEEKSRIKNIYDYVRVNFQQEIRLDEMANLVSMTVPSFCRYFKNNTKKTFSQFVNEFRVIHACKLLSETRRSIADIAFECGYNNFSHFNKQFKAICNQSPSEYRKQFKIIIS